MTPNDNPTYPNPTLLEAICEIVFVLPEGTSWNPLWFGEFFKLVQEDFSSFQPVSVNGLQIGFGNAPPLNIPSQVVRYLNPQRPAQIQLSDKSIVITSLPVYSGWSVLRDDIEYALTKFKLLVNPIKVTRIGLRYINRIERSAPDETLGAWLKSTDYIPTGILKSLPGFVSLVQTRLDDSNRLNVTVGEIMDATSSQPPFILDTDRMLEREMPLDVTLILQETNRLHDDVWEVFKSAKTEKLERLLNGELL